MVHPLPAPSPSPQSSPAPQEPVTTALSSGKSFSGPQVIPNPPKGLGGEYSGIDPESMDGFERGLARVEDAIGRNEPRIRRTLQRFDLDTSGLGVLREARSWIGGGRPDLRRRIETIRAEHVRWGTAPGVSDGLPPFDEALYGRAARDPDVYAAAVTLTRGAERGEVDDRTLVRLEERTGDETFAVALMNAMGAAGFRGLMAKTVGHERNEKVRRLQVALGKALGTAGSRLSDAWRDKLTSGLTPGWEEREYHGISLALKHGAFGTPFLLSVARRIDAWDRTPYPPGTNSLVMVPLMEALSRHPAAAQDFFAGDPTALRRFLTEWNMSDGGDALGRALEAATLTFSDHEGSPQRPSRGYLSARLASEFVHLTAGRIKAGDSFEPFLKPVTVGHILAGYIGDIDYVAQKVTDANAPGVRGADNPNVAGHDPWGARFGREELRLVMKKAFTDSTAFDFVLKAQKAFTGGSLDHGAAEMAAGRGDGALLTNAKQAGAGFGMIIDAANLAKIEEGRDLDETQKRNVKVLAAVVNTGLAVPQAGAWPITSGVVGAWSGLAEDLVKGEAESLARGDANASADRTRALVHDLTARAMLRHGLFGSADPAAPAHPWASLEGLKKGDDPRDNPNNFLEDDGRTLMTGEEMVDRTAANGTDGYRRIEAYQRWLYQGLSGKPWRDVEGPLNHGFSDGFAQYGS